MSRTNWVYILANRKNGAIYTGSTSNPELRLAQHRANTGSKHVAKYRIYTLVWFEIAEDMDTALQREHQIKNWRRAWKIEMIEKNNPDWFDLTEQILEAVENSD